MKQAPILYVEDNAASRRVMEIVLVRTMGLTHVTMFEDTRDIMGKLAALPQQPHLILLDLNLKPMDGFTVCAMLRQDEGYQAVRIVGLSASINEAEMKRMQAIGFNGAISKPINHQLFPQQLERMLNGEAVWEINQTDVTRKPSDKPTPQIQEDRTVNDLEPVILYVEDDVNSRKVMNLLIQRVMKLPVTIFDNSENFMEKVNQLPVLPNIVFLDIQMQPYDGYEVLKMLRDDGRFHDTIIIAMTANVMSHDVEQLKQAGFSGLIGKPIMKDVFPQLMERILAGEAVWYVP